MGLRDVLVKAVPANNKRGVSFIFVGYRRIKNLFKLSERAAQYLGRPYHSSAVFAKAVAPDRFVCSSLVWYCVKKEFSKDLSKAWLPTVTPSDIRESEFTYTKLDI